MNELKMTKHTVSQHCFNSLLLLCNTFYAIIDSMYFTCSFFSLLHITSQLFLKSFYSMVQNMYDTHNKFELKTLNDDNNECRNTQNSSVHFYIESTFSFHIWWIFHLCNMLSLLVHVTFLHCNEHFLSMRLSSCRQSVWNRDRM